MYRVEIMIKELNKLGYTKVELLIVVVLVGIVAFITINKTSYAFAIDNTDSVEEVKNLIELQAEDYAMDNLDLFKETDTNYIIVDDLVEAGYMIGDNKGLVIDPSNSSKSYNDNKIKLEYNKDKNKVVATLID